MSNNITDFISQKTTTMVNTPNTPSETETDKTKENTKEEHNSEKVPLKKNYDAISKNGDTLELSEAGKALSINMNNTSISGENNANNSGKKLSDAALIGYPEAKLKQLYLNKVITKQQYQGILQKRKK